VGLGVIAGSALRDSAFAGAGRRVVHGGVAMLDVDGTLVLQRHGLDSWSPPHRIDHRAHVAALLGAGVDRVLALSSVGSLRTDWPVGTCVLADDCYAPRSAPSRSSPTSSG
jgi:5'-methylthioadenosine phosphorylase